jgi:hypothetical protein
LTTGPFLISELVKTRIGKVVSCERDNNPTLMRT